MILFCVQQNVTMGQGFKHDPERHSDWRLISSAATHLFLFENTKSLRRQKKVSPQTHIWGFILVHTEGMWQYFFCFPHSSNWMCMLAQRDDLAVSSCSALALANWYFPRHDRVIHLKVHIKLPHDYKIVLLNRWLTLCLSSLFFFLNQSHIHEWYH